MNREEIQFKILDKLYRLHFTTGGTGYDSAIPIARYITVSDQMLVNAELRYLNEKNLVNIEAFADDGTPGLIKITAFGIDRLEEIVSKSVDEISKQTQLETHEKITELKKEESPWKRMIQVIDFIKQSSETTTILFQITKSLLTGTI